MQHKRRGRFNLAPFSSSRCPLCFIRTSRNTWHEPQDTVPLCSAPPSPDRDGRSVRQKEGVERGSLAWSREEKGTEREDGGALDLLHTPLSLCHLPEK
ncbi:uncharacterized [Tachysurus ichikawai]